MNVFIYGVPGVGKTHYSKIIGKELGISIIEADKIKRKARENKPKREYPFLYLGTCLAYKQFGELNKENAIKGLLTVRNALREAVEAEINTNEDMIIEGAFLDPNLVKGFGRVILITSIDEQKHKKQFLRHREKLFDFKGNEFKAARILQEYLINEAKSLGVEIVNNDGNNFEVSKI
jgi:2-phosphoglycerate kinase